MAEIRASSKASTLAVLRCFVVRRGGGYGPWCSIAGACGRPGVAENRLEWTGPIVGRKRCLQRGHQQPRKTADQLRVVEGLSL